MATPAAGRIALNWRMTASASRVALSGRLSSPLVRYTVESNPRQRASAARDTTTTERSLYCRSVVSTGLALAWSVCRATLVLHADTIEAMGREEEETALERQTVWRDVSMRTPWTEDTLD